METHTIKLRAGKRWTLRGPLSAPPALPATKSQHHVGIHLIELPVGVARPEVVPPAAKDGSQFRNKLLHIFPALPLAGDLSNTLPEFLRCLGTWPPLQKMPTGLRWMLRLLRIVHPRNTKPSLPRRKSTNRVFAGCSVNPSRSIISPIRRSASLAADSVRHMATKSSAYRISFPSWPHRAAQIRSSLFR